jgi:RNA polymerase sigma-70 factor, ECF subfamily
MKPEVTEPPEPVNSSVAGEITELLSRPDISGPEAQGRLLALVYPELKRIAEFRMRGERPDHTLQPTALVSEFYLHVARLRGIHWKNRAHFLAVASSAMRRVLVDYARAHTAAKRGGGLAVLSLSDNAEGAPASIETALELNELLDHLAAEEPRMARVVELRYYGGLTNGEIGEVLGIDERTVKRDWQVARAWLRAKLRRDA